MKNLSRRINVRIDFEKIRRYSDLIYKLQEDIILVRELDRVEEPNIRDVEIRPAEENEEFLRGLMSNDIVLNGYLRHGYRGFVGFLKGNPFGYVWLNDFLIVPGNRHPGIDRHQIHMKEAEVCLFSLYVHPSYRGSASGKFLSGVCRSLARAGYKRAYGWVDQSNVAARWLYASTGWSCIGRVSYRRLFYVLLISGHGIFVHTRAIGNLLPSNANRKEFDFVKLANFPRRRSAGG